MAESNLATLLVDFDCISQRYVVDDERSPGMALFVLDQEPEIEQVFAAALDELYPDYPWSSPGNSRFRRVCGWLRNSDEFPEINLAKDNGLLLRTLDQTRRRMVKDYQSGAYSRHYWPDVPTVLSSWATQYSVVVFSATRPAGLQDQVLELAAPGLPVKAVIIPNAIIESRLEALINLLPSTESPCLLIIPATEHALASLALRRGIRCVLVDREWVTTPFYEQSLGLYVQGLQALDPARELARELARE